MTAAGGLWRPLASLAATPATIRLLAHSSYNPNSDRAIGTLGDVFAAKNGVTFAADFVDQPEEAPKLTAEELAGAGHDIVDLQDTLPTIHKNFLVPLDDIVAEIQREFGPFYPVAKNSGYVEGHWLSVPWLGNSYLAVYRADYFAEVGERVPGTWTDVLRCATKLKRIGHPVGIAMSQTEDANAFSYPLLLAFGASVADPRGRLTIDSAATRRTLAYVRLLSAQMEPVVYGWDDTGNNDYMLSGRGSYTLNPPSIYLQARDGKLPIARDLRQVQPPAGPVGRFFYVDVHGWGIFKFSRNVAVAKRLIRSMYTAQAQQTFLTLGAGYDMPVLPHFDVAPPYDADPQLRPELHFMPQAHLASYPAPPDARAEKAYQTFVIPNMFARAAHGASDADAIDFAVRALTDIGYSK